VTRFDAQTFVAPTFGQRLGGRVINGVLAGAIFLLGAAVFDAGWWRVTAVVLTCLYEIIAVAVWGRTLGKVVVGTRIVSMSLDGRVRLEHAVVRYLVLGAPALVFAAMHLRWLTTIWTAIIAFGVLRPPLHRGIHDLAARTIVVPAGSPTRS
jgi:uncharacterized RDD family membrane protein YckC